nr:hypothetical protein [Micromonospora provocatoris]
MTRKAWSAAGLLTGAAAVAGLGVFLSRQELERADQFASVIGVLLNVVATIAGLFGVAIAMWAWRDARSDVDGSTDGSGNPGALSAGSRPPGVAISRMNVHGDAYIAHEQHFPARKPPSRQARDDR